jgi:hypothetical protein
MDELPSPTFNHTQWCLNQAVENRRENFFRMKEDCSIARLMEEG